MANPVTSLLISYIIGLICAKSNELGKLIVGVHKLNKIVMPIAAAIVNTLFDLEKYS